MLRRPSRFIGWLVCLFLWGVGASPAQASVDLVYFRATPESNQILLEWETATELDIVGFYVQRSTTEMGGYTDISDIIFAQGEGLTGAIYEYPDTGAAPGVLYYYMLKVANTDGTFEYEGPASATLGGADSSPTPSRTTTSTSTIARSVTPSVTPTATASGTPAGTSTPSRTPTLTPTGNTATPTPSSTASLTRTPSRTPLPQTATQPAASATLQDTLTASSPTPGEGSLTAEATKTLLPLPEITVQFPAFPATATVNARAETTPSPTATLPTGLGARMLQNRLPSRITFLVGIIALLWLLLAYFLITYVRRIQRGA